MFKGIINTSWEACQDGRWINSFSFNLENCKQKLICYNKSRTQNCKIRISELVQKLEMLHDNHAICDSMHSQIELKTKLAKLWKAEDLYLKQRSKVNWIKHWDSNTCF